MHQHKVYKHIFHIIVEGSQIQCILFFKSIFSLFCFSSFEFRQLLENLFQKKQKGGTFDTQIILSLAIDALTNQKACLKESPGRIARIQCYYIIRILLFSDFLLSFLMHLQFGSIIINFSISNVYRDLWHIYMLHHGKTFQLSCVEMNKLET